MSLTLEAIRTLPVDQRIIQFDQAADTVRTLQNRGTRVIVANGVMDILHLGHIKFGETAHEMFPDEEIVLALGLENDVSVRRNKGPKRPVNTQDERAYVAASARPFDLVWVYPDSPRYDHQEEFINRWKAFGQPSGVLVPVFDPHMEEKRWQAAETGTSIVVANYQHWNSTTHMLRSVGYEE